MMYRFFAAAMAAGLLAAVVMSVVEAYTTTPLILAAEELEIGAPVIHDTLQPDPKSLDPKNTSHAHDPSAWSPQKGLERFLYTLLANTVTGISFSLMLVVGLSFGDRKANQTKGLMLALAGFTAFTLAPVLGLPPELPAMPTVDLVDRQIWWAFTVGCTLTALYCIFCTKRDVLKGIGLIVLVAPHVWGAPHPTTDVSQVPATLAAHFAASSIVISALFWALMGILSSIFYQYFKAKET